jgi:hypothetical protein
MTDRYPDSIAPWWREASTAHVARVIAELCLRTGRGGSVGPCPACGDAHRGSGDKRGPIGLRSDGRGWRCHRCGTGGNAVQLVAYVLTGAKDIRGPAGATVRAWFAARGWCEAEPVRRTAGSPPPPRPPRPKPPPPPEPEPPKPRPAGVLDWFAQLERVDAVPEVADYLRGRGIDPVVVADRFLARAVPRGADVPTWAYRGPYRLVVPLFDATGAHASVRFRPVVPGGRKSLAPRGCDASGVVFACGLALEVLRRGTAPTWWPSSVPFVIRIVEGEIDYLTIATRTGMDGPAILGIPGSGAWRADIAARIPVGSVVRIATHQDEPGEKYAKAVFRSLRARACTVVRERWNAEEAA